MFSPVMIMLILTACSSEDTSYFPLTEGHWWEYQETLVIRDESQSRRRIVSNIEPVTVGGKKYFVQESQDSARQYFTVNGEGVFREKLDEQKAEMVMPLLTDKERTWSLSSRLGVIESRTFALEDRILTIPRRVTLSYSMISTQETVVVPAGRFKNCMKVRGTGFTTVKVDRRNGTAEVEIESLDWYAPGVGLIKTERTERSNSTFLKPGFYTLELLKTD